MVLHNATEQANGEWYARRDGRLADVCFLAAKCVGTLPFAILHTPINALDVSQQ